MRPTISNIRKVYLLMEAGQQRKSIKYFNKRQKDLHLGIVFGRLAILESSDKSKNFERSVFSQVLSRYLNGPSKEFLASMEKSYKENPSLFNIKG